MHTVVLTADLITEVWPSDQQVEYTAWKHWIKAWFPFSAVWDKTAGDPVIAPSTNVTIAYFWNLPLNYLVLKLQKAKPWVMGDDST